MSKYGRFGLLWIHHAGAHLIFEKRTPSGGWVPAALCKQHVHFRVVVFCTEKTVQRELCMLGTEKRKRSKRKKNVDQGEVRQTDGPRAVIQYDARKQWALVVASEAGEEGG